MNTSILIYSTSLIYFFVNCCQTIDSRIELIYDLIRSNSRSLKPVITRKEVNSLQKCMDFAEWKRALAFNFGRTELDTIQSSNNGNASCILYDCPETNGLNELVDFAGSHYYSAFPEFIYHGPSDLYCVPRIGIFARFLKKENYTNAQKMCRRIHSTLADVASYERTRGIANISRVGRFYIGLSNHDGIRVWKNEFGDRLSCFDFRAWGPGEPSYPRGCIALDKNDTDSEPIWKVMDCHRELPYICEIPSLTLDSRALKSKFFTPLEYILRLVTQKDS